MAAILSAALRDYTNSAGALSAALDTCFVYFYDGVVPDTAEEAIDSGSQLILKLGANTGGTTGCTWDPSLAGVLPKAAAETWDGLIANTGTPTFFRICVGADTGAALSTTALRWQDTAGGPASNAEAIFAAVPLIANGTNRDGFGIFQLYTE